MLPPAHQHPLLLESLLDLFQLLLDLLRLRLRRLPRPAQLLPLPLPLLGLALQLSLGLLAAETLFAGLLLG